MLWRLVKSDLPPRRKKATALHLDRIFGLGLADWRPAAVEIPDEVTALVGQRDEARRNRDWHEADRLRAAILAHGFEIEDFADGGKIRRRRE